MYLGLVLTGDRAYAHIPTNGLDNTGRHEPKRIAVVGAGIAGLIAATELARVGHDVVVLEARNRPGGRIHTLRDFPDGLHTEAGAAYISEADTLTRAYAAAFAVPLRGVILESPAALMHIRDTTLTFADYNTNPIQAPIQLPGPERGKSSARMWRDATAPVRAVLEREGEDGWRTIQANYRNLTLREYLEQAGWSDQAIAMLALTSQREPRMNATAVDELYAVIGLATSETYEVVGGASRLPAAIYAKLADRVRFGARVTTVAHTSNDVVVGYQTTAGPQQVRVDRVIVTTPATVTQGIEFTPGLSRAKARALRALTYYPATVTALTFAARPWEAAPYKLDSGGTTVTDLAIRRITYPTYAPDATTRGILRTVHMYGPDATTWAALPPEARTARALADVGRIHPETLPLFEASATHTWGTDPYALGGVSAFGPGDWDALGAPLAGSDGQVWFAGEHTSPRSGTIEGAIESGLRAASGAHGARA